MKHDDPYQSQRPFDNDPSQPGGEGGMDGIKGSLDKIKSLVSKLVGAGKSKDPPPDQPPPMGLSAGEDGRPGEAPQQDTRSAAQKRVDKRRKLRGLSPIDRGGEPPMGLSAGEDGRPGEAPQQDTRSAAQKRVDKRRKARGLEAIDRGGETETKPGGETAGKKDDSNEEVISLLTDIMEAIIKIPVDTLKEFKQDDGN